MIKRKYPAYDYVSSDKTLNPDPIYRCCKPGTVKKNGLICAEKVENPLCNNKLAGDEENDSPIVNVSMGLMYLLIN